MAAGPSTHVECPASFWRHQHVSHAEPFFMTCSDPLLQSKFAAQDHSQAGRAEPQGQGKVAVRPTPRLDSRCKRPEERSDPPPAHPRTRALTRAPHGAAKFVYLISQLAKWAERPERARARNLHMGCTSYRLVGSSGSKRLLPLTDTLRHPRSSCHRSKQGSGTNGGLRHIHHDRQADAKCARGG
jgi:hypothetical protein